MVIAATVITPPVALILKLKRWRLDLDLVGATAAAHEGIVRVSLTGDMKYGAREVVGNTMVPAQVGEHVLPGLVVVNAKMV